MRRLASGSGDLRVDFCRRRAFVLAALVTFFATTSLHAQSVSTSQSTMTSGFTMYAPTVFAGGPLPNTNGLSISVEKRDWPGDVGYFRCEVTVTANPPLAAAREIKVRLSHTSWWAGWSKDQGDISAATTLLLAPRAATASTTILLPQYERAQNYQLAVWENGERLRDLNDNAYVQYGSASGAHVLDIGPSAAFPRSIDLWDSIVNVDVNALPTDWLGYTSVDAAVIERTYLAELVAKHPERWKALRAWVATGGNLWVYNVAAKDERRAELLSLLELKDTSDDESTKATSQRWRAPAPFVDSITTKNVTKTKPPSDAKFVWTPLGCGTVVAMEMRKPASRADVWYWAAACDGTMRADWSDRHGGSPNLANSAFWTLTIPGMGLPPIGTFQVLITLFVIGIGPLNYFLLRRRHRLNLMVVTVPLGAAVISSALVAYALFSDGLSTRMRTRSFTMLDQPRGEAVCWSRLSYYAALAHSSGLRFDRETAVYPMEPVAPSSGRNGPSREIVWDSEQRLTRGWLPARTATQLVTARHRASSAGLEISASDGDQPPRVVNHLGCRIERLWLVDPRGRWYSSSSAKPDADLVLTLTDAPTYKTQWRAIYQEAALRYPGDWQGGWLTGRFFANFVPAEFGSSGSILERNLHDPLEETSRRAYVAVTNDSPELQRGLEPDSETSDFHVIVGHW